ncbi:lytic transglycosylase [Streptomyces sp. NPDC051569]|uniref:lytic transglycosylase n=1 Tax=Streptomyces sp. NPDC051569 TaxID=3365661 RepID=UPI003793151A
MAALFGRRLRRGATTTAAAVAAIAALSASQAPGAVTVNAGGSQDTPEETSPRADTAVTGNSPYYTELPPLITPGGPGTSIELPATGPAEAGIPASVLAAYKQAEQTIARTKPGCNLPWQLLAAIGKVESGQARGGRVDANGTTLSPILGPVLNGVGFANISDTDNGEYDGDSTHDRAVGPMQFIPSTWATWGQDANGDGRKDPNNIFDAALAAGLYLCAGDRDLSVEDNLHKSILGYNHSTEYLNTVLSWFQYYKKGTHEVPNGTGVLPVGSGPANSGSTPSPSPVPSNPTPGNAPSPGPTPSKPTPGTPAPSKPTPAPGDSDGPGTPVPAPVVKRIENTGAGELTAVAGSVFTGRTSVRAVDAAGKPVADVRVQFEIVGDTDARFTAVGGALKVSKLTVITGKDGTASAPPVQAGRQTGKFTVRATVAVSGVAPVEYAATVTAPRADGLARISDQELTAAPGAEFAAPVEVKATYKGAAASGVAVTAAMITSADDATTPVTGPCFKDAAGNPVRSLTDLRTDADGVLRLPKIYADDTTGTFLLRLETEGGATLIIELKVA